MLLNFCIFHTFHKISCVGLFFFLKPYFLEPDENITFHLKQTKN